MNRRTLGAVAYATILAVAVTPVLAAQGNIEITPFVGYTFSEGIDFNPQDVNGVQINELIPQSGFSYGVQGDYVGGNWAVGFQLSDQLSDLEVGAANTGTPNQVVTDMNVRNYHGIFSYLFGRSADQIRPYLFLGLGATNYSFGDIMGNSLDGTTRFSTTWGGGVRYYLSDVIGVRAQGRWTPTYINSDASGIWCSPYWPFQCWVVGDPNYSHQFEMTGGVIFRF